MRAGTYYVLVETGTTGTVSYTHLRMTNTSSVQIETLEKTWNTIVSGIDETKRIQEEAKRKREEDSKRLDVIKQQYAEKMKGL